MTALLPQRFLKDLGFEFTRGPSGLDKDFLKSFDENGRIKVKATWLLLNNGQVGSNALYALPTTQRQAALLFSHDRERIVSSLAWIAEVQQRLDSRSVVDMGCGAGYLLRYLRRLDADMELWGTDQQHNLIKLIPETERINTLLGDYRHIGGSQSVDLIVYDFGWDNSDIKPSQQAHTVAEIEGQKYCPGCSDDQVEFFEGMFQAADGWAHSESTIAFTGRLTNIGMIRSVYLAAERTGWHIGAGGFIVRKLRSGFKNSEQFPSFLFTRSRADSISLDEVAKVYANSLARPKLSSP